MEELEDRMKLKAQKYEDRRHSVVQKKEFLDMLHEHNSFMNKEIIENK